LADTRLLGFLNSVFQLVNTTDFSVLFSGGIMGIQIVNGDFLNSTHVVLVSEQFHFIAISNNGGIDW